MHAHICTHTSRSDRGVAHRLAILDTKTPTVALFWQNRGETVDEQVLLSKSFTL